MDFMNFTYIFCLTTVFVVSVFASIKLKIINFATLKYILPSIFLSGALFVFLGIRLTGLGITSFNTVNLTGVRLAGLPLEEYISLVIFPFLFLTVYLWVSEKNPLQKYYNYFIVFSLILLAAFILATYFGRKYFYTLIIFLFSATFFGFVFFRNLLKDKYPSFYISLLISFCIWLVFSFLKDKLNITTYDDQYISGIRLISVPVEDAGNFFLLYLMNITFYDYFSLRKFF
jgi:lycopene cyclase domain-containing protein